MTKNHAIVPVREFAETKHRLSDVLTRAERAELTWALLSKVLRELEKSQIDRIILVAADADETRRLVPALSKVQIIEESKHHGGVNRAMKDGLKLVPQTSASNALLLPSDLPLITSAALDRATDLLDRYDMIINPSNRQDGTNLLGFRASIPLEFYYDNNSVTNHIAEAQKLKLHYFAVEWKEFSTDLDDSHDLNALMKLLEVVSFSDLILKLKGPQD